MMTHRFVVTPNLCIGCRTCELACSFAHNADGKPGQSRIFALPGGLPELWVPVTCLQCEDPACAKACLVDAISRNPETGAMEIDQEKCVKCMACIAGCPFGCSLHDKQHDVVIKCDLCSGDPACAKYCPTKALVYQPVDFPKPKVAV